MGSSFGGFLAAKYARRHPEMVDRLILVDPAGLFPTLDKEGAYWGVLFSLGLPTRPIRAMFRYCKPLLWLLYGVFDMLHAPAMAYYWIQVQADPSAINDHICAKFISLTWKDCQWNDPAIVDLVELHAEIPISFIHGEKDTLFPPHQSLMAARLLGGDDDDGSVQLIQDAWHMPFHIRGGADFVQAVLKAMEEGGRSTKKKEPFSLRSFPFHTYRCTFSFRQSMTIVTRLYADLEREMTSST